MSSDDDEDSQIYVTDLRAEDVLLGRGTGPNEHHGNCNFRDEITKRKVEFENATSRETKEKILKETVRAIKSKRGRFLRKLNKRDIRKLGVEGESVYEVADIETIYEKIRQAFRYVDRRKRAADQQNSTEEADTQCHESPNGNSSSGGVKRIREENHHTQNTIGSPGRSELPIAKLYMQARLSTPSSSIMGSTGGSPLQQQLPFQQNPVPGSSVLPAAATISPQDSRNVNDIRNSFRSLIEDRGQQTQNAILAASNSALFAAVANTGSSTSTSPSQQRQQSAAATAALQRRSSSMLDRARSPDLMHSRQHLKLLSSLRNNSSSLPELPEQSSSSLAQAALLHSLSAPASIGGAGTGRLSSSANHAAAAAALSRGLQQPVTNNYIAAAVAGTTTNNRGDSLTNLHRHHEAVRRAMSYPDLLHHQAATILESTNLSPNELILRNRLIEERNSLHQETLASSALQQIYATNNNQSSGLFPAGLLSSYHSSPDLVAHGRAAAAAAATAAALSQHNHEQLAQTTDLQSADANQRILQLALDQQRILSLLKRNSHNDHHQRMP